MSGPDYKLMGDIEQRYRNAAGVRSRADYSIFYGPLQRSRLVVLNANPGGSALDYRAVDVMAGKHEYVEGRNSGATTRNGSEILAALAGSTKSEALRRFQVFNRFFRRSPSVPSRKLELEYMQEAAPFLQELIKFVQPEALLFGGDGGVKTFAEVHGGRLAEHEAIMGPNGASQAVYHRRYELKLPWYPAIPVHGIYHPSKMNSLFRAKVLPRLIDELGPLVKNEA